MHPKPKTLSHYLRCALAWPWEILAFMVGFHWLYRQTMPPGISSWVVEGWDSAVLQVTGTTWGIPHSPAYPIYTIITNLFVRWLNYIPYLWDTGLAWRVSFWSMTTSLLTLVFLYFTIWKLTRHRATAFAISHLIGFSFIFWRAAIMAEVYSFNTFIFVFTYWLALLWANNPRHRYLVIIGLLLGVGIVHHRTAFILPPTIALGVFIISFQQPATPLSTRFWLSLKRLGVLGGLACLPLLTYLYLPWAAYHRAGQTWLYADATDWNTFWFMVVTREWWGLVQPPVTSTEWLQAGLALFQQQADQITPLGVLLGITGLLMCYRYGWLLWPPFIALTIFGTAYKVADLDSMLIPLTLTLCIGLGIFVGTIATTITRWSILFIHITDIRRLWVRRTVSVFISLMILFGTALLINPLARANYSQVNLSDDWQAEDLIEEVIAIASANTPLTIIGQDNSVLPDFIYTQIVLGYDLEPLSTTTLSRLPALESQHLLQTRFQQGHRVFVDKETIDLGFIPWLNDAIQADRIFMAPTGHPYLWELLPRPLPNDLPAAETVTQLSSGQYLEGHLSILAVNQQIINKRTGCFLRLTLFWQAHQPLTDDYYIAYLPLGGEAVLDKVDHLALMRGYLPTSHLIPGEIIRDEVDLLIHQPTDLPLINLVANLYQVQGNEFPSFGEVTLPITANPRLCN